MTKKEIGARVLAEQGLTARQIAEFYKVPMATVREWLRPLK